MRTVRLALALLPAAWAAPTIVHLPLPNAAGDDGFYDWQTLGVEGLHVGSGLGLPKGCLNTDIEGISDPTGARTSAAQPFAAVRLSATDTRLFLQHDARYRFPVAGGSFEWVFAEHFLEHVDGRRRRWP